MTRCGRPAANLPRLQRSSRTDARAAGWYRDGEPPGTYVRRLERRVDPRYLHFFWFRPRTLLPVAIASAVAAGMRIVIFPHGGDPLFPLAKIHQVPTAGQLLLFVGLGLVAGFISVALTRSIYWVEDTFRRRYRGFRPANDQATTAAAA